MAEETKEQATQETEIEPNDLVHQSEPEQVVEPEKQDEPQVNAEQTEAAPKHEFDKVRQQVQQEIGNKIRPLEERLDRLVNLIESGQATRAQEVEAKKLAEKVDVVKDELDTLADSDPETVDPYKGASALAKRIRTIEQESTRRIQQLERDLSETRQSVVPAQQAAYQTAWKQDFARLNPTLADKADTAYTEFQKELADAIDPSEQLPPKTLQRIATKAYQSALSRIKTPAAAASAATTTQATEKSVKGATIAATGSPARRPADNRKEKTDDELIAGFFPNRDG